jgi:hypothetical protein
MADVIAWAQQQLLDGYSYAEILQMVMDDLDLIPSGTNMFSSDDYIYAYEYILANYDIRGQWRNIFNRFGLEGCCGTGAE